MLNLLLKIGKNLQIRKTFIIFVTVAGKESSKLSGTISL